MNNEQQSERMREATRNMQEVKQKHQLRGTPQRLKLKEVIHVSWKKQTRPI